ncbi:MULTISPECIES: fumarylacetoacetase [Variovorax]|uniref:fumarylacetoacetase n=1 Tax=Variovorax paradoxus TaxID=34073 RepID=UPI001933BA7F|nr:fumarylacetoacetase [Variovorax paradoxus]
MLNFTHDPAARSWVDSAQAPGCDFTLQNLPFGIFVREGSDKAPRGGIAIGDQVLDLAHLAVSGLLMEPARAACCVAADSTLNAFMAMGRERWQPLRHALFKLLSSEMDATTQQKVRACMLPMSDATMKMPVEVRNYTDFYTSLHHAINVGRVMRPENPLTPNFQWLPIAYHGRASSVVLSGTGFRRPNGQSRPTDNRAPAFGPCRRLDFELEMGFFVGQETTLGEPLSLSQARDRIFGMCLLNDWSARDHQFWEMDPLGPFLGKNFCTSISPWIVSMEALEPYRVAFDRPATEPQPLPYLDDATERASGSFDVHLEVSVQSRLHRAQHLAGDRITATSFRHQYWTIAQMLVQHTIGGCNLRSGDLMGTGTISGPAPDEAGALVELSRGGTRPVLLPGTGETRHFLEDGDSVTIKGWCEKPGAARIGFGECRGEVLPALELASA